MSRLICELETILQNMIAEHQKLLGHIEAQQAAMKRLETRHMNESTSLQDACRRRIAMLEQQRQAMVVQIARELKVQGPLTLSKLAALHPPKAQSLLKQRAELRGLAEQIRARAHVAGRVAGAVLGHLNTVVRLLAGAVEKAGLYTRTGTPQVSRRIGVMEAVG